MIFLMYVFAVISAPFNIFTKHICQSGLNITVKLK